MIRRQVASLVFAFVGMLAGCGGGNSGAVGTSAGAASEANCVSICARMGAANCAGFQTATCEANCKAEVRAALATCKPVLDTLASCALGATYTCGAEGPQACATEERSYDNCKANPPQGTSSGASGGNTGVSGGLGGTGASGSVIGSSGGAIGNSGGLTGSSGGLSGANSGSTTGTMSGGVSGATSPQTMCPAICAREAQAQCANSTDCMGTCQQIYATGAGKCQSQLDAYATCVSNSTFTCDADGESRAQGCDALQSAFVSCVGGGATSGSSGSTAGSSGGSTSGSNTGTGGDACAAQSDDTACEACARASCCTEARNCAAQSCFDVGDDCIAECQLSEDENCVVSCYQRTAAGQAVLALNSCIINRCAACNDGGASGSTSGGTSGGTTGSSGGDYEAHCLPRGSVPTDVCGSTAKPFGHECGGGYQPFPDCVPSGIHDVWCCGQ